MNQVAKDTRKPGTDGREIMSISPATGQRLGRVRMATEGDVTEAARQARRAQGEWAAFPFKERAALVLRAKDILVQQQDELCDLISNETGKPAVEAMTSEVFPGANLMDYFARNAATILREERFGLSVFRNKRSRVTYEPVGVVGVISPWNYPFSIPLGQVVMGLMAGNAVLLKPSDLTVLTGMKIAELFRAAELPEGLLQVLPGDGAVGKALVGAAIDKVFFTGSVATGRQIAQAAAARLLPCMLELGGKDAMIVCADAPFERAVNGAVWGAFNNCGQACASVERLYVVEAIADRFIAALVEKTRTLRVGAGRERELGPLNNERQLKLVMEHVDEALAKGAQALTGGRRVEGLAGSFYEPTVLVGVNASMRVMNEETFGPVLPVMVVKDHAEAIREANRSRYGLLASVWTRDTKRGQQIAERIEAGTVIINDVMYTHAAAETPWFGIKESGMGVTHSKHGLREFARMKHVNWDLLPLSTNLWWFPYSGKQQQRFRILMRLLHRWGLKKWV